MIKNPIIRTGTEKAIFAAALILFTLSACFEKSTDMEATKRITATGTFSVVGNVPFQKLVFRSENGATYEVAQNESGGLIKLQGQKATITGTAESLIMTTPDGKIKRKIQIIKNITFNDSVPEKK